MPDSINRPTSTYVRFWHMTMLDNVGRRSKVRSSDRSVRRRSPVRKAVRAEIAGVLRARTHSFRQSDHAIAFDEALDRLHVAGGLCRGPVRNREIRGHRHAGSVVSPRVGGYLAILSRASLSDKTLAARTMQPLLRSNLMTSVVLALVRMSSRMMSSVIVLETVRTLSAYSPLACATIEPATLSATLEHFTFSRWLCPIVNSALTIENRASMLQPVEK
ncbi:hypothetical protein BHMPCIPO_04798 [Ensifer sesbaniae]|nr:hypothetical protein [Ensifer sesbaniae]